MTFTVLDLEPFGPEPGTKKRVLRYMVVAVEDGSDDGVRIYRTLRENRGDVDELAKQIAGCEQCQRQYLQGEVGPRHKPSARCRIGGRDPHCTCDACAG